MRIDQDRVFFIVIWSKDLTPELTVSSSWMTDEVDELVGFALSLLDTPPLLQATSRGMSKKLNTKVIFFILVHQFLV